MIPCLRPLLAPKILRRWTGYMLQTVPKKNAILLCDGQWNALRKRFCYYTAINAIRIYWQRTSCKYIEMSAWKLQC